MNNDLISRSALLEFARNHIDGKIDCNDIARFPYANAATVRHGRWLEPYPNDMWDCYKCSCCDYTDDRKYNFCPNCGCKMDAEVSNDA